jgi:hypothetical protein
VETPHQKWWGVFLCVKFSRRGFVHPENSLATMVLHTTLANQFSLRAHTSPPEKISQVGKNSFIFIWNIIVFVLYLSKPIKLLIMKTRNEDYREVQDFIKGMTNSFIRSIDEREVIPQDLPKRLLVMLLEDEDGEYCNGGGPLTGTPLDIVIIPDIMGKVQRDGNRIVCMMEMVFKEDEMKAVFAFVGEMGEEEEKYTETHTFKINEGEMYIGENGELVYPLSVMELVE